MCTQILRNYTEKNYMDAYEGFLSSQ